MTTVDVAGSVCARNRPHLGKTLALVGGANRDAIVLADESYGVHATLGLAIVANALISAAGGTYFLATATHSRPTQLWWAFFAWAIVIGNLDRALVMAGTNRRTVLMTLPLRAVIALLIGYWSAAAVLQIVYAPEITAQVASDTQRAYTADLHTLQSSYQAKITAAEQDAAEQQQQLTALQARIDAYAKKADCEAQLTDCSDSHILGRGPIWRSDQRTINRLRAELAAAQPAAAARMAYDRTQARTLTAQLLAAQHQAATTNAAADGWAARSRALGELKAGNSSIQHSAWLLIALLATLDLAPVLVNALILLGGEDAYSEALEAVNARRHSRLRIVKMNAAEEAAVAESWSQAREDVAAAQAAAWADDRINGLGARRARAGSDQQRSPRVAAVDSASLARASRNHSGIKLPIPRSTRRLGWIATATATGTAASIALLHHTAGITARGALLAAGVAAALLAFAAATRGFRSASLRAQRWSFAAGLTGLALPLTLLAINV